MCPPVSQIITHSAPLQLKKLPVFVYEGAPEYVCSTLFECFLRPCLVVKTWKVEFPEDSELKVKEVGAPKL